MSEPMPDVEPCRITAGAFCLVHWSRADARATTCDHAKALGDVGRLRAGIEALHSAVQEYESCPGSHGCDDDACTESVHNGERYHADQPVGLVCLMCRDEDGAPLDWPCETANLLNPTEGETNDR